MIKLIQIWSLKFFGLLLKYLQFLIVLNLLLWRSDDLSLIQSRWWTNDLRLNNLFGNDSRFRLRFRLLDLYICFLEGLIELILNFVFHRVDIDLLFVFLFPFVGLFLWTPVFNRSLDDLGLLIFRGLTAAALRRRLVRRWRRRWFRGEFKDCALSKVLGFFVYLSSIIRFLFLFLLHGWYDLGFLLHSKYIRSAFLNIYCDLFESNDL